MCSAQEDPVLSGRVWRGACGVAKLLASWLWRVAFDSRGDGAYDGVRVLEHERAFPLIRDGFEQRLAAGRLTRRMWFGLLSSYFSWRPATGAGLAGWAWLRTFVQRAFAHMKESARAVRTWMSVVDRHQDVFGDTPGARLGEALARLDTQALEEFRSCLHVPAESWFWHAMVDAQLSHVSQLGDTDFEARIAPMLELAAQLPTTTDALLEGLRVGGHIALIGVLTGRQRVVRNAER